MFIIITQGAICPFFRLGVTEFGFRYRSLLRCYRKKASKINGLRAFLAFGNEVTVFGRTALNTCMRTHAGAYVYVYIYIRYFSYLLLL
jgi:hypothetical protein